MDKCSYVEGCNFASTKIQKHDMGNVRGKRGWFGRVHETLRRRLKRLLPFLCPLLFPHPATEITLFCITLKTNC